MTAMPPTPTTLTSAVTPARVREVLGRHMLVDGFHLVVDLEKSLGSRIRDAETGKWYLDFYTFFASCPLGMNHPGMREPHFVEKLLRTSVNKPSNSDAYTVELAEFVETVERLAMPPSLPYLFLVEGGAVAVENALKTAFDWKVRKNLARGAGERGHRVLHFRQAFHGRTGYALSLTNTDPAKTDLFPKFDWPRVENPRIEFPRTPESDRRVEEAEARALAHIEECFADAGPDIAAVILEPIQGEGGDNHFRPEFLRALRRICDEKEALLILDEVQTGVGITGRMWAYQHFGIEPDILVFGKKLQVCGIMASRRLDEVPDNVFRVSSRINSTWGGNLADMARGARYLEIIEDEKLVTHADRMGELLKAELQKLELRYAPRMSGARGRGLMCAFDLDGPELRKKVMARCQENGLLMLGSGTQGIRFRPALNVTREDIEEGIARIDRSLSEAIG